jgi:hypothetical protein
MAIIVCLLAGNAASDIRPALGAQRRKVLASVLGHGLVLC